MAEIQIERKERSTWPWVLLGLLLLALLAWWLLSRRDGDDFATTADTSAVFSDTGTGMTGTAGGTVAGTGSVQDYIDWARENRARAEADTTHEFTADGIRRLAAAIEAVAQQGGTTGAQQGDTARASIRTLTDSMRTHAEALQREWQSPNHANRARQAFTMAARALQQLREQRFPQAASTVQQVEQAAQQVQGDEPLLEQRQEVDRFFDLAAQTLQSMQGTQS